MHLPLIAIASIMSLAVMKIFPGLFIMCFLAILLSLMLHPLVVAMVRKGIPKGLAITLLITMTLSTITLLINFLIGNLSTFLGNVQSFIPQMSQILENFLLKINISDKIPHFTDLSEILSQLTRWGSSYILKFANSSITFLLKTLYIALLSSFLLLEMQNFYYKFHTTFSEDISNRLSGMISQISSSLRRYLLIKTFVSVLTGLSIYLCMKIINSSYALGWGVLGFVLNFIPIIGSTIIMTLTMAIAIIQPQSSFKMWFILISMPAIQILYGQILEPRLQGKSLNISPFILLIGIYFWSWMWGMIGVFLSVPMMVFLKIILATFGPYRSISNLMGIGLPPKNWKHRKDNTK